LAQSVENFYRGRSVDLIVGYGAGGDYDAYSRLAARHLSRFVPGNPTVVVKNMQGVGSLKALNYLYSQAPQDGSAIGMMGQTVALEQLVTNPAVRYDARQFTWIGRIATVGQFIVARHDSGAKTLEDVMKREVMIAATSSTGATGTVPRLLNRLGGTKFKIIYGYGGITELVLALDRNEVQAATASSQMLLFTKPELKTKSQVSLLVSYAMERSPLFPDVPALSEFGLTENGKRILRLYASTTDVGRALVMPPKAPSDRVQAFRLGLEAMMKDPEFIAEANKLSLELDGLNGVGLAKIINDTVDVPSELAKEVAAVLQN
jgi:tripartite-type tricarboxylate transporter receptor subunit TctC